MTPLWMAWRTASTPGLDPVENRMDWTEIRDDDTQNVQFRYCRLQRRAVFAFEQVDETIAAAI